MARLVRTTFTALKIATPFIAWVAVNSVKAMLLALISLWRGTPDTCRAVADEWTLQAIARGFPTVWENILRNICFVVALFFVFVGWVILSYVTVILMSIVF